MNDFKNRNKQLNEIGEKHFNWVNKMNWHTTTDLECLALILSEVDEAYREIDQNNLEEFAFELADIVLRLLDVAKRHDYTIDIDNIEKDEDIKEIKIDSQKIQNEHDLAQLAFFIGRNVNYCRSNESNPKIERNLMKMIEITILIAQKNKIDLFNHLEQKIIKNEQRGKVNRLK
jgi:hypothetical protein